jgi:hypothetical protein
VVATVKQLMEIGVKPLELVYVSPLDPAQKIIIKHKEEIIKEITKGAIIKEDIIKETIIKETIIKETIIKETIIKETIIKETIIKEAIIKQKIIKKVIISHKEEMNNFVSVTQNVVIQQDSIVIKNHVAIRIKVFVLKYLVNVPINQIKFVVVMVSLMITHVLQQKLELMSTVLDPAAVLTKHFILKTRLNKPSLQKTHSWS